MASSKLTYTYPDQNNLSNIKIGQVDPEKNLHFCLNLKILIYLWITLIKQKCMVAQWKLI